MPPDDRVAVVRTEDGKLGYLPKNKVSAAVASGKFKVSPTISASKPESLMQKLDRWYTTANAYQGTLKSPGTTPQEKFHDMESGAMVGGLPALGLGLATAPAATLGGVGLGYVGSKVGGPIGEWLGKKFGAPQIGRDTGELAGGTAGGITGEMAGKQVPKVIEGRRILKSVAEMKKTLTGAKINFGPDLQRTIDRGFLPEIERQYNPKNMREAAHAVLDTADM